MKNINRNKTLSVIIPAYNVESYLKESVDSVLSQTILPHEVIIINDGSTDDTGKIAEDLYGHYDNVKIIHTQNKGLGEARNIGTRAATGDFIYYFDSDDVLELNLFESFYSVLIKHPDLDIFHFSADSFVNESWLENKNFTNHKNLPEFYRGMEEHFCSGEEAFSALVRNDSFNECVWLYIFSRKLLKRALLVFSPVIHEDIEFTIRLFFVANKIIVTQKIFIHYRVRHDSIMHSNFTEQNIIGHLKGIAVLDALFLNCTSLKSRRYIQKRINRYIIIILRMQYMYDLKLSSEVLRNLNNVVSNYGGLRVRAINYKLFVCQFIKDRLRRFNV